MNNITLIGRLTRDPEIRYSNNEKSTAIANFSIAVDRKFSREGQQKTDFINCVCFGKTAENLIKYQHKGSKIAVHGELNIDLVEDNGEKKSYTKVKANEIEYLQSKNESAISNNIEPMGFEAIDDDDIPF